MPLFVALASGVITAAAFEPVAWPVLAPLGVAGLLVAITGPGWRATAWLGLAYGVAFQLPQLFWLAGWVGTGAWLALGLAQACWFVVVALAWRAVRSLPGWWLAAAAIWVAVEGLRSAVPLGGMPWSRLGFSAIDSPWAPGVAVVGVTGTSWVLAVLGTALGAMVTATPRRSHATWPRRIALLSGVLALSLTPTAVAARLGSVPSGTARVAVVQGGVPGDGTRLVEHHREVTRDHLEATRDLTARIAAAGQAPPDLVVWPENATAVDPYRDEEAAEVLRAASAAADAPLLAGSVVDVGTRQAFNRAILWTSAGPGQTYTKQHLVPFGEYVPWRPLASRLSARVRAIQRDMVPGTGQKPLRIPGFDVADALCFDIAYDDVVAPQVAQGAEIVAVQTSNAMFLGTSQLEQQFAITRVRAVEVGRAVVVASVNGQSGAVGPDGRVLARLPVAGAGSFIVELPLLEGLTPAVRLGGSLTLTAYLLAAASLIPGGRRLLMRGRRRPAMLR
ncbi:MAG: apolipoprotein N-acyltransferase [Propionibacteriaceae bacterium]